MISSKWLEYVKKLQCDVALAKQQNVLIDYGEEIYSSPEVNATCWKVCEYKQQFNVFVEHRVAGEKRQRLWNACFRSKDRALSFALKMLLICSGKLRRKDLQQI